MRSCWEMRQDAWKIMTGSKWGWKILLNGIVLYAIMIAVVVGLDYVFEAAGIQTWESFREAQREAKQSGVDLAIASGRGNADDARERHFGVCQLSLPGNRGVWHDHYAS